MIALRADDDIDYRGPGNDLIAFRLGDAARDRDQGFEALAFALLLLNPHPAELGINLLGGLFPDVARVEDDKIGLGQVLRQRVALRLERLGHALGVVGIHLAAEGLDIQLFGQFFLTRRPAVSVCWATRALSSRARTWSKAPVPVDLPGRSSYLPDIA